MEGEKQAMLGIQSNKYVSRINILPEIQEISLLLHSNPPQEQIHSQLLNSIIQKQTYHHPQPQTQHQKIQTQNNQNCFDLCDQRQLEIIQRKILSNLKLQMQQTLEKLKLLEANILQVDIKNIKKELMETQIYVRRLRIKKRQFKRRNNQMTDPCQEYFQKKQQQHKVVMRKKMPSLNLKKRRSSQSSLGSVTQKVKNLLGLTNQMGYIGSQENQERKNILKSRISHKGKQILAQKELNDRKTKLLEGEKILMQEELLVINRSSLVVQSEVIRLEKCLRDEMVSFPTKNRNLGKQNNDSELKDNGFERKKVGSHYIGDTQRKGYIKKAKKLNGVRNR